MNMRQLGRRALQALQATYPPNLWHILRSVDTRHLSYERRFLSAHPLGRDEWGIVFPYGMGDLYVACAFASHVRARYGGSGFAVFVQPHLAYIPTLFPAVTRIEPVADFDLKRLHQYFVFEPGRLFTAFPLDRFLGVLGYKGISFLDYFCLFLNLPPGTRPDTPRPQSESEVAAGREVLARHGLRQGRTVILAPRAASTAELPGEFWRELAVGLAARGLDVATNSLRGEAPVAGTRGIDIPLAAVISTAQAAGSVVSARSGLCELLAHARCRLTVLYPDEAVNPHPMLTRSFGMVASGWRPDATEVWYAASDPKRCVAAALQGAG